MIPDNRAGYVTRDHVMKLLSDSEVARVSNAETAMRLDEGDEYIDLERIEQGVRRADGLAPHMVTALPRKSVEDATWAKILSLLPPTPSGQKN